MGIHREGNLLSVLSVVIPENLIMSKLLVICFMDVIKYTTEAAWGKKVSFGSFLRVWNLKQWEFEADYIVISGKKQKEMNRSAWLGLFVRYRTTADSFILRAKLATCRKYQVCMISIIKVKKHTIAYSRTSSMTR